MQEFIGGSCGFEEIGQKLSRLSEELFGHLTSLDAIAEAREELEQHRAEIVAEIGEHNIPEIDGPLEALDYRAAILRELRR
jgi:hypothetical protein